jgi:hypothetical protein
LPSDRIAKVLKKPDAALIDRLEIMVTNISRNVETNKDVAVQLAEFNEITGQKYIPEDFFELYGWTSDREFAERALYGLSVGILDLSRDELREIIAFFNEGLQPESSVLLGLLDRSFAGSFSSDLIYWPHREMTPDETIDELFHRRDLFESGGAAAVQNHLQELANGVLNNPDAPLWATHWAQGFTT